MVLDGCNPDYTCYPIVRAIKEWNGLPMQVIFKHVLRECNEAVDAIAKLGLSIQQEVIYHIDLPSAIAS